jgi:acetate kinase
VSAAPLLVCNAGSTTLRLALIGPAGERLWADLWPWSPTADPSDPSSPERLLAAALPAAAADWPEQPALVGHRVVHGGDCFTAPTPLQAGTLAALEELLPLAPLHNGPALRLIRWLQRWRPELPQWACFDTAFHATLPPAARTYALPESWRRRGLRRFGFHGINHQHVAESVARLMPGTRRLISCHLGGGCSLCAVADGRSVATTMGYTPLEGLVMASRSGSVDPGLLLHELRRGLSPRDLERTLQQESGLLGLSGLSGDMAELRRAAATGHPGAGLAIAVFRHRLLEGIGAMAACLGGVEVIALSGGIGEHDDALKGELEQTLAWLGPPLLLRVPADEEGMIARSCRRAAQAAQLA